MFRQQFSLLEIDILRAEVARGAGHECEEWVLNHKCQLCDREHPETISREEVLDVEESQS